MAHSEDDIALAAEYALGTLDAEERARVEAMMAVDKEFHRIVQDWDLRLGSLNQMVGPIEPRPVVWESIRAAIARLSEPRATATDLEGELAPPRVQAAPVVTEEMTPPPVEPVAADDVPPPQMPVETVAEEDVPPPKARDEAKTADDAPSPELPAPELPVAPVLPEDAPHPRASIEAAAAELDVPPQAPTEPEWARDVTLPQAPAADSNVIDLASRVRRWRNVASFATAIAAALLVTVGLQAYRPDLLPAGLRPVPRTEVVEVKTPASASGQFVAVLQQDGNSPAFILTVDAATKNFTVRRVGAQPEAGKSYELWLISDRLPQPRSLGVIGAGDFTARPALSSFDSGTINDATYAVTVEPAGGSPSGQPTSAPVFSGKLIESVPPATATPSGNTK